VNGDILSLDVGTTTFKLGVFGPDLEKKFEAVRTYAAHVYDQGKADIEPEKWWQAFRECCAEAGSHLSQVAVLSMSVTTPGLTPMAADGTALAPAVLFFDGRSHQQAAAARKLVGEDRFLEETCNLPVSGGSSLCSLLWFRDSKPEIWEKTAKFGHTNTYMVKRLTGEWTIDPSTSSITGMYNTPANDLTWSRGILDVLGVSEDLLPPLRHSHQAVATILPAVADELGLPRDCVVLCGGNDAVLAALSSGSVEPGQVSMVCGTVDLSTVCTDKPVWSRNFNVRCHGVPGRWVVFFVLNAGGQSLEWFRNVYCRDMEADAFYEEYVPSVLNGFLSDPQVRAREANLPNYAPYLAGSRYATKRLTGSFTRLTLLTTRDDMLVSLVRGNARYFGRHLREVAHRVPLGRRALLSGGGAKVGGMREARRRWTGDFEYAFQDQSSLLGSAMLGRLHLLGDIPGLWPLEDHPPRS
jgi:sugar (pentulose or hexulose) kinase